MAISCRRMRPSDNSDRPSRTKSLPRSGGLKPPIQCTAVSNRRSLKPIGQPVLNSIHCPHVKIPSRLCHFRTAPLLLDLRGDKHWRHARRPTGPRRRNGGNQISRRKIFPGFRGAGGQFQVETDRAVLAFPAGSDPSHIWPILIVTSTSDFSRTSLMDAEWYRARATAEGSVVLGADATVKPRIDSTQ